MTGKKAARKFDGALARQRDCSGPEMTERKELGSAAPWSC
jgi:hypothetical protein